MVAVHPYDIEQSAAALHRALDDAERRTCRCAKTLCELAAAHTPRTWLDELLNQAR